MTIKARVPAAVAPVLLAASVAFSADERGGLLGWVEDTRGAPVAGAVISLFGNGVGSAGLLTLSDSRGRFFLPSLPAGSYTIRALRAGQAAPAKKITVVPDRNLHFTMSLTAEGEAQAAAAEKAEEEAGQPGRPKQTDNERELAWLLRHKRRSVLETRTAPSEEGGHDAPVAAASWAPDLGATLEPPATA